MSAEIVIAAIGISVTLAGCLISVGLVLAKIKTIEDIGVQIAALVRSNAKQDILLGRLCDRAGIEHFYESR